MNQKELFWFSVTAFLTVVAWMILDIYKLNTGAKLNASASAKVFTNFTIKSDVLEVLKERTP